LMGAPMGKGGLTQRKNLFRGGQYEAVSGKSKNVFWFKVGKEKKKSLS